MYLFTHGADKVCVCVCVCDVLLCAIIIKWLFWFVSVAVLAVTCQTNSSPLIKPRSWLVWLQSGSERSSRGGWFWINWRKISARSVFTCPHDAASGSISGTPVTVCQVFKMKAERRPTSPPTRGRISRPRTLGGSGEPMILLWSRLRGTSHSQPVL